MNKSSRELLDMMKTSCEYKEYFAANRETIGNDTKTIGQALTELLEQKGLSKAEVIFRSGIENHYAYQIFSGSKTPSRDKVIMLCLGFGLSVEEVQHLLEQTGYAMLYVKGERDNVILFGFTKSFSVISVNELLYEMSLPLLM